MRPKALFYTRGEKRIRTSDTIARIHPFQGCAFNHSAISPYRTVIAQCLATYILHEMENMQEWYGNREQIFFKKLRLNL